MVTLRKTHGNEHIDISANIWDEKMPEAIKILRNSGIKEFTISYAGTRLMGMLDTFDKNGIKVVGLTKIKTGFTDFETDEEEFQPAILMKIA